MCNIQCSPNYSQYIRSLISKPNIVFSTMYTSMYNVTNDILGIMCHHGYNWFWTVNKSVCRAFVHTCTCASCNIVNFEPIVVLATPLQSYVQWHGWQHSRSTRTSNLLGYISTVIAIINFGRLACWCNTYMYTVTQSFAVVMTIHYGKCICNVSEEVGGRISGSHAHTNTPTSVSGHMCMYTQAPHL